MLSHLRTRKIGRFFDVIDSNGDGVFTPEDTQVVGERLASLRGLAPGSDAYENFMAVFGFYWDDIRKSCDADADGQVTRVEWIAYHERMLADRARFDSTVGAAATMMFSLLDHDGDGVITPERYTAWIGACGIADPPTAATMVAKLDPHAEGFTRERALALAEEFFYSDDPQAPGNWALGPW